MKPRRKAPGLFYELNVRGYTMRHPSVQGPLRGTIAGLTTTPRDRPLSNIWASIWCELMPIAAFIDDGPPAGARAHQCLGLQSGHLFRASIRGSRRAGRRSCAS